VNANFKVRPYIPVERMADVRAKSPRNARHSYPIMKMSRKKIMSLQKPYSGHVHAKETID
jgi:hypothetical protein